MSNYQFNFIVAMLVIIVVGGFILFALGITEIDSDIETVCGVR